MQLFRITAAIAAAALSCAVAAQAAIKSTKVDPPTVTLKRGSTSITPAPLDMVECEARKAALIALDGTLKTSSSGVYDCIYTQRTRIAFGPNPLPAPTCTTPKPAQESQTAQCPAPTVGTWSQTREYVAAAYPTCWTAGEWTPTSAPAGICATATTLVFACPESGADGRILESTTVTWPNCPSAGLKVPSKSLVVAVNTGSQPSYWRLASKVTDGRVWTQTGTVGAWTRVEDIDWGNRAPTISGQAAASVQAGTAYSFTPTAADADGDALTFSIANKPSWATFGASTGKLNGTPAAADVGTYSNILVSVSDGTASVSLPAFGVAVSPLALGTVTLSWTPSTENVDGTAAVITGYRIHYGTSASAMNATVDVTGPTSTSYVVKDLAAGTYFFAVRAVASYGISELSNVATKVLL